MSEDSASSVSAVDCFIVTGLWRRTARSPRRLRRRPARPRRMAAWTPRRLAQPRRRPGREVVSPGDESLVVFLISKILMSCLCQATSCRRDLGEDLAFETITVGFLGIDGLNESPEFSTNCWSIEQQWQVDLMDGRNG